MLLRRRSFLQLRCGFKVRCVASLFCKTEGSFVDVVAWIRTRRPSRSRMPCSSAPSVFSGRRRRAACVLAECGPELFDPEGGKGGDLRGPQVPLHREREHPWQDSQGHGDQQEDVPHYHHPPELPPLHQEVQPVREAAQERGGPLLPLLRAEGGRHRHLRTVPAPLKDRPVQRFEVGEESDLRDRAKAVPPLLSRHFGKRVRDAELLEGISSLITTSTGADLRKRVTRRSTHHARVSVTCQL